MAEMTAPVSVRPKRKVIATALWIMVPLVCVVAPATVLLLVLGLLPTIVAWFVDRREEKYAAYCVGGFNLSGVMPYLFVLWASGNRMHDFFLIAKNPFAWLVMLGAWNWFIDIFAVACILFTLTGLVLLYMHSKPRPLTWPLAGLGLVIPLLVILIFIH